MLLALLIASPIVELACVRTEAARMDCAKIAQKLRIYGGGYDVVVTDADNGVTDDEAIFRVTVLDRPDAAEGRVCLVESIALTEKSAPRTATFPCAEEYDPERVLALHIKGELDGGFEEALRALRGGSVRRGRLVESPLARSLRPRPERLGEEPKVAALEPAASEPATKPTVPPTLLFSLTASGGVGGYGAIAFATMELRAGFVFQLPVSLGVGARVGLRPALETAPGSLRIVWLEPFVDLGYCFQRGRFVLCPAATGELVVGFARLAAFPSTVILTGGAGGKLSAAFAVHRYLSIQAGARVLAAFHRLELASAGTAVVDAPPVLWGADVGVSITF